VKLNSMSFLAWLEVAPNVINCEEISEITLQASMQSLTHNFVFRIKVTMVCYLSSVHAAPHPRS
jgi:hypothetical protein